MAAAATGPFILLGRCMSENNAPSGSPTPTRPGLPLWAKGLAVLSVLIMGTGVALPLVAKSAPGQRTAEGMPAGATGFTTGGMENVGDSGGSPQPEPAGAAAWGPTVFRMGFSFFVGFAIAYALRAFLKLAFVALGFFFLALFGLEYAGLVDVQWGAMSDRYQEVTGALNEQARTAWSAMSVLLPSAAAATAGLVSGFWRRAV